MAREFYFEVILIFREYIFNMFYLNYTFLLKLIRQLRLQEQLKQ